MSIVLTTEDVRLVATIREQLAGMIERIDEVMQRASIPSRSTFESPRLTINFRTSEVTCDGRDADLSALELKLLRYFIDHRGEVLTRDELLDHVWGVGALPVTRTVDVRVAALRSKLVPEMIATVRGQGYRFEE